MGSKSRSRTASTQNTSDVTTSLGDNRVTESGNIGGNTTLGSTGGNVSIESTDFGAVQLSIEGAGQVAGDGLDLAESFGSGSFELAGQLGQSAFDLANSSLSSNATLSNEILRRDQILTASVFDVLGEASAGFDDVSKALNSNAAATGSQLAGLGQNQETEFKKLAAIALVIGVVVVGVNMRGKKRG